MTCEFILHFISMRAEEQWEKREKKIESERENAKDDIQSIFDIYKMNERIIGCNHC